MNFRFPALLLLMLGVNFSVSGYSQDTADTIMARLRASRVQELDQELSGDLRTNDGRTVPFKVRFAGEETIFRFENPPESLLLRLTDSGSVLTAQTAQDVRTISGSKLTESVRGTDVSYEDLALKFLYWDRAKLEGEQQLSIYSCWVILVQPSTTATNYGSVRLWIPKNRSGLVQAEAFDRLGKLVKRFKVISVQEIAGKWILKEMRIERFDPQSGALVSRTYLELTK
jgi:hypothetical protein